MNIDLHCHSNVSDGALAPAEVARRAARAGVTVWSLTDHDQVDGLAEARAAALATGMQFVDGVEISVTWRGSTVHVLGLRIDPQDATLAAGLAAVRGGRIERARAMARELSAAGIEGTFEGALERAENPAMVSRTHFARFLVDIEAVADMRDAFRRFLIPGKPGYVPHQWAELDDAVRWIRAASGHAVLAHPGRYGLSAGAMDALLGEFRQAGGEAIEVVTGSHSPEQYRHFGALAAHHDFAASRGSDFHGPDEGAEFGSLPPLDPALRPVWRDWGL
ncbi:MAG: PHP domain-containing protein [Proteobacteria bacterium]|nr:PHP domain-containing protein [Pseudomonadota bacterium]